MAHTVTPLSKYFESIPDSILKQLQSYFDLTEGMISFPEALLLYYLAKQVKTGCIVEIGSYRGRSSVFLGRGALDGEQPKVYAVDPHEDFVGILGGIFGPQDRKAFYKAMLDTECSEIISLINLPSCDFVNNWRQPVSLLWIDGDHQYEKVKQDFYQWKIHLHAGAMVAFDDAFDQNLGPRQLISELKETGEFEELVIVEKIAVIRSIHSGVDRG